MGINLRWKKPEKKILYSDYDPQLIIDKFDLERLEKILSFNNFPLFNRLYNNFIIIKYDFENLLIEISNLEKELNPWKTFLFNKLREIMTETEYCLYIEDCRIDLLWFLEESIIKYQKLPDDDKKINESIQGIIEIFFHEIEYHGFDIIENNPSSIAEVLHYEVYEYWSGESWNQTEMYLNNITPSELLQIEFPDIVEILSGFCSDYS